MKAARWIVAYVVAVELLYAAYEWQVSGGPQDGNALALGLVLTVMLMPSMFAVAAMEWYLGQWLGYAAGDTAHVLPRLISFQIGILLNCCLLIFVFRKDIRRQWREKQDA